MPGSVAAVGIDMGVSDRLALSNGERVGRRRKASAFCPDAAQTVGVQEGRTSLA